MLHFVIRKFSFVLEHAERRNNSGLILRLFAIRADYETDEGSFHGRRGKSRPYLEESEFTCWNVTMVSSKEVIALPGSLQRAWLNIFL